MSLDVSLVVGEEIIEPCEHCGGTGKINQGRKEVFSSNITHNLNNMAKAAGIYEACWRPEEIGVTKAGQLIPLLRDGIEKLEADPVHFRTFDAPNGWGRYEHFVPWVREYLEACVANPESDVRASR